MLYVSLSHSLAVDQSNNPWHVQLKRKIKKKQIPIAFADSINVNAINLSLHFIFSVAIIRFSTLFFFLSLFEQTINADESYSLILESCNSSWL